MKFFPGGGLQLGLWVSCIQECRDMFLFSKGFVEKGRQSWPPSAKVDRFGWFQTRLAGWLVANSFGARSIVVVTMPL